MWLAEPKSNACAPAVGSEGKVSIRNFQYDGESGLWLKKYGISQMLKEDSEMKQPQIMKKVLLYIKSGYISLSLTLDASLL